MAKKWKPVTDDKRSKMTARSFKEALRIDTLQKMYQEPKPVTLPRLQFLERRLEGER